MQCRKEVSFGLPQLLPCSSSKLTACSVLMSPTFLLLLTHELLLCRVCWGWICLAMGEKGLSLQISDHGIDQVLWGTDCGPILWYFQKRELGHCCEWDGLNKSRRIASLKFDSCFQNPGTPNVRGEVTFSPMRHHSLAPYCTQWPPQLNWILPAVTIHYYVPYFSALSEHDY